MPPVKHSTFPHLYMWKHVKYHQISTSYFSMFEATPSRSSHSSIFYKNRLYLFCGELTGEQITNTTLCYNVDEKTWDVYYTGSQVSLSCRRNHTTSLIGNLVYLFGGDDNRNNNDMFCFDLDNHTWSKIVYLGDFIPMARRYHVEAVLNGRIYIFGGESNLSTMLNDISCFDPLTRRWEMIEPRGKGKPGERRYSTMIEYKRCVYVFGGRDNDVRFNDVWEYNPYTNYWRQIATMGYSVSKRASHTAVVYGSSMYIYGGMDGNELNELVCLDLETFRWTNIDCIGVTPKGKYWHTSAVSENGMMYSHGGGNDQHIYDEFLAIQLRKRCFERKDEVYKSLHRGLMTDVILNTFN